MQDFYLIRHGETDWNVKFGKLQGHTDIPLNEKGRRQAQALLELTSPLRIQKIISSDLVRAQATAQHMSGAQGPHETHQDLREVHLGIGEGMTWDEITLKLGSEFRDQWSSNEISSQDLRFPQGESRREVLSRVKNCLLHFLNKYPGETLAFVTHGFVIRTLVQHLNPGLQQFPVPNCAVVPFAFRHNELIYKGPANPGELLQPRIAD